MSISLFKRIENVWFHATIRIETSAADDYLGIAVIQSRQDRKRNILAVDRHVLWIREDQVLLDVLVIVLAKLMRGGYWRTNGPRRLDKSPKTNFEQKALCSARRQTQSVQLPLFWNDSELESIRVM